MANIKLVYINPTGGYVQPSDTADVAQSLGKLELTGVAGVALDVNNAQISGVPAVPAASDSAASKAYVDSVAGGFSWVAPVEVVATSPVTLSGTQTIDGVGVPNGARVLITGQNGATPDVANGIYIVNTVGAWPRSSDTLEDGTAMFVQQGTVYHDTQFVLTTNNPITPGVTPIIFSQFGGGVAYTAGNGIDITGSIISAKPNTAAGIDATGSGIEAKINTAAGVAFDGSGNIEVNADTAKALKFDGVSGKLQVKADSNYALTINATDGLRVVPYTAHGIDIDASFGIEVNADTNKGLQFDGVSGKLQVNAASAGGLNFSSGALQVNIYSADQLTAGLSGLQVVGVPLQFKIDGTQVSTNVNATNLSTLTDSVSITGLHRHSGLYDSTQTAAGMLAGNPAIISGIGTLETAAASSPGTSGVVGVAVTTGGSSAVIKWQSHGLCSAFSGLTPGVPYYLGNSGGVVPYSSVTSGNRAIRIGYATDGSTIMLNIQDMGVKP